MKFSLIVCTYKRPSALCRLLDSVAKQSLHPDEIIIVDGSPDEETEKALDEKYQSLYYHKVTEKDRGLTNQRNYGISKIAKDTKVVCFLDDDIELTTSYFEKLLNTYIKFPDAVGVGGYILNEVKWEENREGVGFEEFEIDGWKRKLGSRNLLRRKLGLLSDKPPGVMPEFSNGFSIGFLPPSGKVYPVEFFMGGVSSYRQDILRKLEFSSYFQGYGLYEDMDFCLRASKFGQLYVNTAAVLFHYHDSSGRPNLFNYGKMVIRNGWYVWRVKYPKPSKKARLKWNAIAGLLTLVRLGNAISTPNRKEVITESMGRIVGWWSLIFKKPQV